VAANTLTAKRIERGIAPPSVNHERVVLGAEDSTGAAAAPGRHAAAAATKTAHAAPRAPFPLTAAGQEAPQAMARRMSTIAGMRSGEQLTNEDAFEATAVERRLILGEATNSQHPTTDGRFRDIHELFSFFSD